MREHAQYMSTKEAPVFDDSMSSFFRNVRPGRSGDFEIPVGDGKQPIYSLRARAVCIDMEEGVLNEVKRGPLGELFDANQFVKDVSGSGNNWAHGHCVYGPQYEEAIMETVRHTAEKCESLQSFFVMHSLGGGTGSGLGTYILHCLADQFPDVYRFNTAVFPSGNEDVITSPYNSVLALNQLREFADCVLPIDNQALIEICKRIDAFRTNDPATSSGTSAVRASASSGLPGEVVRSQSEAKLSGCVVPEFVTDPSKPATSQSAKVKAFDDMNSIGAHLLTSLTASIRFPGPLNVDLNEITMNLVPFPRMHFLVSSMSPLYSLANSRLPPRGIDQMFSDTLLPEYHLMSVNPKKSAYLACSFLARGPTIQIADLQRNVTRVKSMINLVPWNADGFKVGLCSVPPYGLKQSVLSLSNNCCIRTVFEAMEERFMRLYRRRAHVHHYTDFTDASVFDDALDGLQSLIYDYNTAERTGFGGSERLVTL